MKKIFFISLLLFMVFSGRSQSEEQKWVVGLSASFINFGDEGLTNGISERYNFQIPKLNVARYIFAGLSLEAGATLSVLDRLDGFYGNAFNYFSVDGAIRYDFNLSDENLVPYIALGGSIVGAPSTIPGSVATGTINFSFGGTYWISHRWGLNVQATYKSSPEEYASMRSHSQFSAGLVYSLSPRTLVFRLWDQRR